MNLLSDAKVATVVEGLHREADAQRPQIGPHIASLGIDAMRSDSWPEQMKDFYLPVSREQGRFLYLTVRAINAYRVVEFGTSFGVSTIYLAAGLRDNGGGVVVGSELVEEKAAAARQNLDRAGLSDHVDIRSGDARVSLADPGGPVNLVLLDGGPALYVEVLQLLVPNLLVGAVVIADNTGGREGEPHPYTSWVNNPKSGFVSTAIGLKGGTEYSVWLGDQG